MQPIWPEKKAFFYGQVRVCMLAGCVTMNIKPSIEASGKHVPPWRKGQPKGQGMDCGEAADG